MGINKIKLKQIDADFSGLVGEYGSGYFSTIDSFNQLSGSCFKYADLETSELVFQTGDQNISGVKDFLSDINFRSNAYYENGEIGFTQSTFTFNDNDSINSFANNFGTKFVVNGGSQSVSGLKVFINGLRIGGGGGSGVLYSGQINPIYVSGVSSNLNRYIIFSDGTGDGFKNPQMDSGLNYNPSTKILSASTFKGGFSGNSLSAEYSSPLNISAFNSGDSINFNFTNSTPNYTMTTGYFGPVGTTSVKNLGSTSVRWKEVFASVGTINTSDRNLKTEISQIPDSWLDAWQEVDYVRYKFKDAVNLKGIDNARWHIGHIAQDVYEAFDKHGINAFDIGIVCYDRWSESIDQNGNVIPSGEIWSIRADECQFMELALMRRSINRLKSGIQP